MSRKIILRIAKNICIFYECLCKASVKLCVKCLEGTTERSDSNTKFADESERSELSEQTR